MELLKIGKIVNTHGIKGEIRIISDFKYKEEVFKKGNNIIVGNFKENKIINSYRVHKNYDMITFSDINDINDVLKYKGSNVYINRDEYNFSGIIYEDLLGMNVYSSNILIGEVVDLMKSNAHPILVVKGTDKQQLIPFIDQFIINVDVENKKIEIEIIEGLLQ